MDQHEFKKGRFNEDRRSFFKYAIAAVGTTLLSPYFRGTGGFAMADAALPLLKESDPTATALGYAYEASKVDKKKWTKKAGPDGPAQKCSSCMFFTGSDKKSGKCQIFPNNVVASGGWCNSWTKKA